MANVITKETLTIQSPRERVEEIYRRNGFKRFPVGTLAFQCKRDGVVVRRVAAKDIPFTYSLSG